MSNKQDDKTFDEILKEKLAPKSPQTPPKAPVVPEEPQHGSREEWERDNPQEPKKGACDICYGNGGLELGEGRWKRTVRCHFCDELSLTQEDIDLLICLERGIK
jgi:hypothetical protein